MIKQNNINENNSNNKKYRELRDRLETTLFAFVIYRVYMAILYSIGRNAIQVPPKSFSNNI